MADEYQNNDKDHDIARKILNKLHSGTLALGADPSDPETNYQTGDSLHTVLKKILKKVSARIS